ncbi:MAG: hypothetical protein IPL53_18350 [Ignavibacteria bacterium]|nr:hypothetical protein [Ignavibacteria bacterium]
MRIKYFLFPAIALILSTLLVSCGSNDKKKSTTSKIESKPISIKQFDTPPGADPLYLLKWAETDLQERDGQQTAR